MSHINLPFDPTAPNTLMLLSAVSGRPAEVPISKRRRGREGDLPAAALPLLMLFQTVGSSSDMCTNKWGLFVQTLA